MTQAEQIKVLEARVTQLEQQVNTLIARELPMYPHPMPAEPLGPWPWQPGIAYPIVTCDTDAREHFK